MSKNYFFLSLIFFFLLLITGTDLLADNGNRVFYNVSDIHGISIIGANSVCEDDNGFMWVSSKSGVFRFTEDDERQYDLPYVTANVISVKLLFRNSKLFAYTNNGQFFKYDSVFDRFEFLFDLRVFLKNERLVVSDALLCNDSSFYIAATFGLYKYSDGEGVQLISETSEKDHFVEWYDDEYFFHGHSGNLTIVNSTSGETDRLLTIENEKLFEISQFYFHEKQGSCGLEQLSEKFIIMMSGSIG
ncbi:hypothetical protein [Marinilabilia salmonicolor]|uniref:hypothetical protein n=1 Tax=Marinilabilia salmonicolor TaxID=989 RepID=UPI00056658E2|nr:hypothetical protein [Marinilabilia salmonicolor]